MAMAIMIAAVVLVGVLCLLDLLLTFGVIRRLREHTTLLAALGGPPGALGPGALGLETGKQPGAFSAVTTSGEVVTQAAQLRMVGFLTSSCSACPERVPPFMEYLSSHRIGRDSVLVVIQGGRVPYLDQIAEVALVCVEPADGEEVVRAFKVNGSPVFFLLDADGAVAESGYDPAMLPAPAAV